VLGPIKNKPVQFPDGTIVAGSSVEIPKPFGRDDTAKLWLTAAGGLALVIALSLLLGRLRPALLSRWWCAALLWVLGAAPILWTINKLWFSRPSEWQVHFERSTDGGLTWANTPPLNDGTKLGAIQPSILLGNGDTSGAHLQAVGRTRQKKVFTISSDDGGKTWGKMSLLDVPNPSAGTDAVTLRDGRHLLVCNPVARGRTPLAVYVSRDGRDWKQAVVLESEKGEFSYPAIIQTTDGKVHITYTWKRERIKHTVLDPKSITP
jgi:predicted neuraminidase